jgi:hypothetical protein
MMAVTGAPFREALTVCVLASSLEHPTRLAVPGHAIMPQMGQVEVDRGNRFH